MRGWWNTAVPTASPFTRPQPGQPLRTAELWRQAGNVFLIDQFGIGNQFRQHHGHGLQRLDFDFFVAARIDVLDAQHPDRAFAPHDRHPGEGVELVLTRFVAIGKVRVGRCLGQVEHFDIAGDRADQPFADCHAGDVDRFLRQPLGGEQFKHPFAQQVDRADFAIQPHCR